MWIVGRPEESAPKPFDIIPHTRVVFLENGRRTVEHTARLWEAAYAERAMRIGFGIVDSGTNMKLQDLGVLVAPQGIQLHGISHMRPNVLNVAGPQAVMRNDIHGNDREGEGEPTQRMPMLAQPTLPKLIPHARINPPNGQQRADTVGCAAVHPRATPRYSRSSPGALANVANVNALVPWPVIVEADGPRRAESRKAFERPPRNAGAEGPKAWLWPWQTPEARTALRRRLR